MMQLFNHFKPRASKPRPSAAPIPKLNRGLLARLREYLHTRGFIQAMDTAPAAGKGGAAKTSPELEALKGLFGNGAPLAAQAAGQLFEPSFFRELLQTGLFQQTGDQIRAVLRIQSYDGLLFFSDFQRQDAAAEAVLSIGPSGQYLASLTIRRPVESALDLGCGCGIQALTMSRHAARVTATDINPRALALTRLNAELNLVSNVEVLQGSYFEPVRGRTFDLIVANLPYVITPENKYIYRDLGRPDDELIRGTVQQMPEHLNQGGFALMTVNWIHRADEGWWRPVMEWTKPLPAEAWVIHNASRTPEEYTRVWIGINEKDRPREYKSASRKWLAWYRKHGIQRLGLGVIALKRSDRPRWTCAAHAGKILSDPLGGHVLDLFEAQEYLAAAKEPANLLNEVLEPRGMKVEQKDGLHQAGTVSGFLLQSTIGARTAEVLSQLDGRTSLAAAIRAAAPEAEEQVLKEIYHLANLGMVRKAGGTGDSISGT